MERTRSAHEEFAQLDCEAASSIRTVAALTREADCLWLYGQSQEAPLKTPNWTSPLSRALYASSQPLTLCVIVLNFWYGIQLATNFGVGTLGFFNNLMVSCRLLPASNLILVLTYILTYLGNNI